MSTVLGSGRVSLEERVSYLEKHQPRELPGTQKVSFSLEEELALNKENPCPLCDSVTSRRPPKSSPSELPLQKCFASTNLQVSPLNLSAISRVNSPFR